MVTSKEKMNLNYHDLNHGRYTELRRVNDGV